MSDDNIMLPEERQAANMILSKMGLNDSDRYEDEINYDLSNEYERYKDVYDNRNIVKKPESVKRKEIIEETERNGQYINAKNLTPLKNKIIMKMNPDREEKTKSGILLADLRPVKQDNPEGVVVALNKNTEYDFKIGDSIVIDLRYVKHRYNYQNAIHLILDKDGVLGVLEDNEEK